MKLGYALVWLMALGTNALAQVANPHIVMPQPTPGFGAPDAPMLPFHFAERPQAPSGQKFGTIASVALTPEGHLLVLNRNPQIMMVEYDRDGGFLRTFNPNIAVGSHGMRVDRHGNIWVTDSFLNLVWKLNARGEPLMMLGRWGEVGAWDADAWNGMFNQPTDVGFDSEDNLYVVQGHGGLSPPPDCTYCATYKNSRPNPPQGSDPRIFKFDKNGKYLASRSLPHEDGTYPNIHAVVVTPNGELWVADRQRNTIRVFDTHLNSLRDISEPCLVSGLFVDAMGHIWMSSGLDGMVASLDADGRITGWIGQKGRTQDPASNLIGEAHYLAVTPDQKEIYVADAINAKVVKLVRN